MKTPGAVLLAPSPHGEVVHDAMYYLKGAAAGGICCSITHGALTPVDVVKTRVQLDPVKVRTIFTWTMPPTAFLSTGTAYNLQRRTKYERTETMAYRCKPRINERCMLSLFKTMMQLQGPL